MRFGSEFHSRGEGIRVETLVRLLKLHASEDDIVIVLPLTGNLHVWSPQGEHRGVINVAEDRFVWQGSEGRTHLRVIPGGKGDE